MSLLIDIVKTASFQPTEKADAKLVGLRVSICESCPFMKDGMVRSCGEFMRGGKVNYKGAEHELCGCNIDDKATYFHDHCPLKKW